MRVIFILDFSFPSSSALSNRIMSLSEAIVQYGNSLQILCINGTYYPNEELNKMSSKIPVIFSTNKFRNQNFLMRNFNKIKGFINSFFVLYKENKREKIDVVFIPRRNPAIIIFIVGFCKILKIKIAQEISEYPEVFVNSFISRFNYIFYRLILIRFVNGIVLMTNNLKEYFTKLVQPGTVLTELPMTVDIDRFSIETEESNEKYIAYCGSINNEKDGIDILIKAFSVIANKFPEIKLYIIGTGNISVINRLRTIASELICEQRIRFTGFVPKDDIPALLKKAKVLALARPSSKQTQGGFPTKLGEYLSTKNPVVVTDVGEITRYLKDGDSAFISAPDSIKCFADKLDECLSDYEKAKVIGEKGYSVALDNFDYRSQAHKLNSFLGSL